MSLSDKIIEVLDKHGPSLSSSNIREILEEKYRISRTQRTLQRHIQALVDRGALTLDPPLGREQTYSLKAKSGQKSQVTAYLLKRLWREEEEIEKEYLYGDQLRAANRARFLIAKLPEKYRNKLLPVFKELRDALEEAESGDPLITRLQQEAVLKGEKGTGALSYTYPTYYMRWKTS